MPSSSAEATFSVVIPAHNAEGTIARCIESVRQGGLAPEDQLIVVDDGSSDGTASAAARAGGEVITLGPTPSGAAVARNRGADHARGRHLVFCDADVLASSGWRVALTSALEENPWAGGISAFPSADPPLRDFFSAYKQLFIHHTYRRQAPGEMHGLYSAFCCIRRELFFELGGFDETFTGASFEDLDFGLRAVQRGELFFLTDGAQWRHLHHYTWRSSLANDFVRARGYVLTVSRSMGLARLIISKRSANNAGPYLGLNLALTSGAAALPMAAVPMLGGYLLLNRKFLRLLSQVGGLPMAAGGAAWGVVDYWAMALGICAGLAQTLVNSCRTMDTINLHYQLDEPRLK